MTDDRNPSPAEAEMVLVPIVQEIIARHTRAHWVVEDHEEFPEPDGYLAEATEIVTTIHAALIALTVAPKATEVPGLLEALGKFGRHKDGCAIARALPFERRGGGLTCTCGFDEVRFATPQPVSMPERIVRAAMRHRGKVYDVPAPGRHHHVIRLICSMGEASTSAAVTDDGGFLTSAGRYVDREEAWTIAEAAGQLLERAPTDHRGGCLYSEDVW